MGKRNNKKNTKNQNSKNTTPISMCIKSNKNTITMTTLKDNVINDTHPENPKITDIQENPKITDIQENPVNENVNENINENVNVNVNEKTDIIHTTPTKKFVIVENFMENLPAKEKVIPIIIENYIPNLSLQNNTNVPEPDINTNTNANTDTLITQSSYINSCVIF
jgi:hypothetical protein